jgi:hypothetical protein
LALLSFSGTRSWPTKFAISNLAHRLLLESLGLWRLSRLNLRSTKHPGRK